MAIILREAVIKEEAKGLDERHAKSLVAQEVILQKISRSRLKDAITLKGGVVMFNKTNNVRRATIDLDVDVIRYSIDQKSIDAFIRALNFADDGIKVSRSGKIEKLKQEDYQGCRIYLVITDRTGFALSLKMDIGVHTLYAIPQEVNSYFIDTLGEQITILTNPNEQIFGEKVLSLIRHGVASTRYKDIGDMYFFVSNQLLDKAKVKTFLLLCLPLPVASSLEDIYLRVSETFENPVFASFASSSPSWTGKDYRTMTTAILKFLDSL
jgi:predicted nucleotidyltransferase component of viral defense system